MQLGTRWAVGAAAPSSLPEVVGYAVQTVEEELVATEVETTDWRWTLTWLEGKPVIELDDGTVIHYNPSEDSATITQPSTQEPDEFDLEP
ncbi:hypothetical protein [Leifsonia poae]|uniref:Uncharacterized protein n=1 Tax=Leifsonia poae TaxID=110933 RepID=A0A9W6HCA6_9MICO|nr:hypothetical protein [Leifsonia poae]GLJ77901.1 hypothetical protein GCM10017584_34750 [Leifsonia poae]